MTDLFICKRSVGGSSDSEFGTRYYIYEEIEPYPRANQAKEWLPIESAPRDGTDLLGYCSEEKSLAVFYWSSDAQRWRSKEHYGFYRPEYYIPLPTPPSKIISEEKGE